MSVSIWVTLVGALLSGSALPSLGKIALRMIRGDVERADRREDAAATREADELKRLLAEIVRLDLERKDREAIVDALRHELDERRHELDMQLVRGNAILTIARILLFAVDQEPNPSPAMIAARRQAQDVINSADDHMKARN